MRVPNVERRRRRRSSCAAGSSSSGVLLVVLLFSLRGLAGFYTDFLWFDSVGFGGAPGGSCLTAKIVPALVFTVVFFVIMLANLTVADRLAPSTGRRGPRTSSSSATSSSSRPYQGRIRVAHRALLRPGRRRQRVGAVAAMDPVHRTASTSASRTRSSTWTSASTCSSSRSCASSSTGCSPALVIVLIVTAVAHYLNGGIRLPEPVPAGHAPGEGAPLGDPGADGAGEVGAVLPRPLPARLLDARRRAGRELHRRRTRSSPALNLLIFISIVAAALFIWNIWRRGWVLPIIAVGLWGFVALVIGTIYPAGVQKFRVDPNEFQSERTYIERNITSTRAAFDLHQVDVKDLDYQETIEPETVAGQPADDRERPPVGPRGDPAHLPDPPGLPDLLPARRRRHRPLRDRRRDPAGDDLGPRAQQQRAAQPVVGQRAPRVHARVRHRRVADQRGERRRRSRGTSSATSRSPKAPRSRSTTRAPSCTSARACPATRSSTPSSASSTTRSRVSGPTPPPATAARTASSCRTSSSAPRSRSDSATSTR